MIDLYYCGELNTSVKLNTDFNVECFFTFSK